MANAQKQSHQNVHNQQDKNRNPDKANPRPETAKDERDEYGKKHAHGSHKEEGHPRGSNNDRY